MKWLFLMMGAPGSGKSTWVKRQLDPGDNYISRDKIRFDMLKEGDSYFAKEDKVYDFFVRTIAASLMSNEFGRVFADASHLNAPSRTKLLVAVEKVLEEEHNSSLDDVKIAVIWMKTTLDTCLKRNSQREGRECVPEDTIISMWKSQRMPKAIEGVDKVYIVDEQEQEIDIIDLNSVDVHGFEY